ncbi:hypothetical protein A8C32_08115 [Flavivirga aquatica]|uniref:Uncharacterized protein n=1 Tax=Flavivirga aquatica TaxID=1849968 RepID=A0A1E5SJ35_9FLAO|nr:hypothetical protein [Flavivirga aquatica]OEJ99130.1 hypothetical protein A8C32_08115 [Flavivirga aquatica]
MRLKQVFITIATIFITTNGIAQSKEDINLPEGGDDLSFYGTIEVFITKNQEVFNKEKKFNFYDDISNFILNKSKLPMLERRVLLYADNKVKYSFIDKIKQEIALVEKMLFLMTDTIEKPKKGYSIYLNSYLNRGKEQTSILTLEQDLKNEAFNSMVPPPPLPPPSMWYHEFEDILYSGKKEIIEDVLKKHSYKTLNVTSNKVLKYKQEIINNNDLTKVLKENDIVLLKFDKDIYYEDYIYAIQEIKKLKSLEKSRTYIVEISYELENLLNKINVSID